MPYNRRRQADPTRLLEDSYHAAAQRAVRSWWQAQRSHPELAEQIKTELPDLVQAITEPDELVIPRRPALS